MRVYLDNAATTPIAPEVINAITEVLTNDFGNPSSTHSYGRHVKAHIENSRRKIAAYLNCSPGEIIFTSGGTEADNMALTSSICNMGIERIITSSIEHHAVGHTTAFLFDQGRVKLDLVNLDEKGHVDLDHLDKLLSKKEKTLVSLMHANNEIGNLLPLEKVSQICRKHHAYFHSDTVQTMGHYTFNLKDLDIDFITGAAHKFHGPKGIGFLYINKKNKPHAFIHGGSQERKMRGGTENVYGIVGLAKAMDLAYHNLEEHQKHVLELKQYMIKELKEFSNEIYFHGDTDPEKSLYTVLNVCFPKNKKSGMLLFTLDLKGVAVSGGSACTSGATAASHVLQGINADVSRPNVRFSFSRYTSKKEIDYALEQIKCVFSTILV